MDTVTHIVAGALTPLAFTNAPKTRLMPLFGIVCGVLPDIDVIAGKTPEAILDFHRGITHALVVQPASALVMAFIFHRLIKKRDPQSSWTFTDTWAVAFLALLIHLFLDCMTTFGTRIFLPFSDFRVALPAMYIIDLALTLPLLAAWVYISRKGGLSPLRPAPTKTRLTAARCALAWLVCYPILALALNNAATLALTKHYAAPGNERGITKLELSPEPFAPLNWKVVGIAPDTYHMGRFFLPSFNREVAFTPYRRVAPDLWRDLQQDFPLFRLYGKFTTYPFQTGETMDEDTVYTFADIRYESTMPGLMHAFGRNDGIFLMQARGANGRPKECRFLYRGGEAEKTPWQRIMKDGGDAG